MTLCRRVQGVEIEGLIISLSQTPCRFDPGQSGSRRGVIEKRGLRGT
jgi:hypothetical protein